MGRETSFVPAGGRLEKLIPFMHILPSYPAQPFINDELYEETGSLYEAR